jgi:hypothetical protein
VLTWTWNKKDEMTFLRHSISTLLWSRVELCGDQMLNIRQLERQVVWIFWRMVFVLHYKLSSRYSRHLSLYLRNLLFLDFSILITLHLICSHLRSAHILTGVLIFQKLSIVAIQVPKFSILILKAHIEYYNNMQKYLRDSYGNDPGEKHI